MDYRHFLLIFMFINIYQLLNAQNMDGKSFTPTEINAIMEADTSKEMRVLKITNYVDSVFLRMSSMPVKPDTQDIVLNHFIARLYKTVTHPNSLGVGIAAPQVGIPRQIILVQRFDKEAFPFECYLNIKIVAYSDSTKLTTEGCLSIPEYRAVVERPDFVEIEYDRIDGSHHKETVTGFTSVIFQHEVDHLNGILYLDHLKDELYQRKQQKRKTEMLNPAPK
ncbi:MAG: peptide deformylase [Saprospiraceae bacterium]|nr:peptide deformylase [Saprospiraceae bacterium]